MTREERERLRALIDRRRRELCGVKPKAKRIRGAPTRYHGRAGAVKVERMRRAFEELGVATQADARRAAGLDSGTAVNCVRALVWEGAIQPTGRIIDRSPEFSVAAVPVQIELYGI